MTTSRYLLAIFILFCLELLSPHYVLLREARWCDLPRTLALLHHGLVLCLCLITRFRKYIVCYLFTHVARCESVPLRMRRMQWLPSESHGTTDIGLRREYRAWLDTTYYPRQAAGGTISVSSHRWQLAVAIMDDHTLFDCPICEG